MQELQEERMLIMEFVLITGATRGIGYALTKIFAKNGYGLVLVSSNEKNLRNIKEEMEQQFSVPVYSFMQDLTKIGTAKELYDKIEETRIPISILINNAGFGLVGETQKIDLLQDEAMMIINLLNPVELSKLFLPKMYVSGKGKILNVSRRERFNPGHLRRLILRAKHFY